MISRTYQVDKVSQIAQPRNVRGELRKQRFA